MPMFACDKCCFCVDLRIGCFILAYMDTILTGMWLLQIAGLYYVNDHIKRASQAERELSTRIVLFLITYLELAVGSLTFAIVLVFGMHKDEAEDIKSYLMFAVFLIIALIITFFLNFVFLKFRPVETITIMFLLMYKIYILLHIRSYYYELQGEEDE